MPANDSRNPVLFGTGGLSINRILFVKLSSLGDVVHSLPLIEALRSGLGPNVTIDWAIRQRFASLVRGNPHISAAYELQGSRPNNLWNFGMALSRQRFDVALDAQGLFVSGMLTRMSAAPSRIGLDRNRECNAVFLTDPIVPGREREHIVDVLMGFCDAVGVPRLPVRPQTYLRDGEAERASELLADVERGGDPVIAFVVGASTADKTWPVERWAETAARLASSGARVAMVGGPSESATANAISKAVAPGAAPLNLVGRTPLPVLASVLAECDVVIGGDSGPMHLAVAVGTPVVGLYGVTDPVRTGPGWGSSKSTVLDYAEADAPPAMRRPRHSALPDAISRIPADAVAASALLLLGDRSRDSVR